MHKLDDELPPPPKSSPFDYDIFVPVFLVIVISVQFILDVLNKEKNKDNLVHFPILQRLDGSYQIPR